MQFQNQVRVTGAKASKGVLDNGQHYDSTTVFIEIPLQSSNGMACGVQTVEFKWGTSENYKLIEAQKLPLNVIASFEMVTTGKLQKTQLVGMKLAETKAA